MPLITRISMNPCRRPSVFTSQWFQTTPNPVENGILFWTNPKDPHVPSLSGSFSPTPAQTTNPRPAGRRLALARPAGGSIRAPHSWSPSPVPPHRPTDDPPDLGATTAERSSGGRGRSGRRSGVRPLINWWRNGEGGGKACQSESR